MSKIARLIPCFSIVVTTFSLFFLSLNQVVAQDNQSSLTAPLAACGTELKDPAVFDSDSIQLETSVQASSRVSAPLPAESFSVKHYQVKSFSLVWQDSRQSVSAKVFCPVNPQTKCPIVIYSHGLGTSPQQYSYLGKTWASHGLISIHLLHPGSDESIWKGKLRPIAELKEAYQKYWNAADRVQAIRFTLDQIFSLAQTPNSWLANADLTRIGVGGNDLGALAALIVAGQLPPDNKPIQKDPRITAVLALSPPVYCSSAQAPLVYSNVDIPFMSFAGTNDDGLIGTTKAYQRRIPYDHLTRNDHYHITLKGADHMVYTGHHRPKKQHNDVLYQNAVRDVSTLFWSAYLQDDLPAFQRLSSPSPAVPRVVFLERQLH